MVLVHKADGTTEQFDEHKVITSIRRAGIPKELEDRVLAKVKNNLREGIPTYEIYQMILEALSESEQPYSKARYSLKQAIMLLGPSGYPFEDFISRIFEEEGYVTQTRQTLSGKCVTHEIDVIAEKNSKKLMVEVKFHNNPGARSEIQVALYVKARFDDIKERNDINEAWIVTNTKTTIDANTYAQCAGMKVLSWNYPDGDSLREKIERAKLHPITMLTTLSPTYQLKLLQNQILLCKDLKDHLEALDELGISKEDKQRTLDELRFICG